MNVLHLVHICDIYCLCCPEIKLEGIGAGAQVMQGVGGVGHANLSSMSVGAIPVKPYH